MTDIDASALHATDAKEAIVPTSADSLVAEVLADPACSYWLRDRIREALERDPLDALRDAETLVAILEARWRSLPPLLSDRLSGASFDGRSVDYP